MGLDYSQKRLLSKTFYRNAQRKASGDSSHAILSSMKKKNWKSNLEVYAFWTGLMSTFISLAQVVLLALKK